MSSVRARLLAPAASAAFGLLMLGVPVAAGPPATFLLLPTGVLTLVLGLLRRHHALITVAAVHGVALAALSLQAAGGATGVLLSVVLAAASTGYLLSTEALEMAWPGLRSWWRRRGGVALTVLAAVCVLAAVALVPVGAALPLVVVGAVALVAATVVAFTGRRDVAQAR